MVLHENGAARPQPPAPGTEGVTSMHPNRNATGHIKRVRRKRGDQWYVKYRLPDGRQVQKRLGPAWDGPGRPPEDHYTRRTAEEALQAILTDARRGTLGGQTVTGARFRDAAAEYLRYVEHVRQIDIATVKDYRGVIDGYLLDEFGDEPLESITRTRSTPTRRN
jgi:integrase